MIKSKHQQKSRQPTKGVQECNLIENLSSTCGLVTELHRQYAKYVCQIVSITHGKNSHFPD